MTTANTPDRLHSVSSAAALLGGISPSTIRDWLWKKRLTRVKVGRRTMVRESELLALIKPLPR
ncbi:MAG TPA: helix-turn-helix domain-containing protein [Terracidiphilus sp.]|jgi:excisionase family DNA binding protein|nr:helix-turn-helix domain-containing protein [Terracidiphilus sp.]